MRGYMHSLLFRLKSMRVLLMTHSRRLFPLIIVSVWLEISSCLDRLAKVWYEQPEPVYQALLSFKRHLASKLAYKLGWEYPDGEDFLTSMLRTLVIKIAGRAGDPQ
jgi:hypothetical protein